MARLSYMTASFLLLSALVWGADTDDAEDPDMRLRVAPRFAHAVPGKGAPVLFTVQIVGPETEKYYCPEIMWVWPNGTRSSEESDCEPFNAREHYPRRFTRRVVAPASHHDYVVCVELRKDDKTFDKDCIQYSVR